MNDWNDWLLQKTNGINLNEYRANKHSIIDGWWIVEALILLNASLIITAANQQVLM